MNLLTTIQLSTFVGNHTKYGGIPKMSLKCINNHGDSQGLCGHRLPVLGRLLCLPETWWRLSDSLAEGGSSKERGLCERSLKGGFRRQRRRTELGGARHTGRPGNEELCGVLEPPAAVWGWSGLRVGAGCRRPPGAVGVSVQAAGSRRGVSAKG